MLTNASLAVKLTLALGLTVLIAVGAVALLASARASEHFQDYVALEMNPRVASLIPVLAAHYNERESWDGVEEAIEKSSELVIGLPGGRQGGMGVAAGGHMGAGMGPGTMSGPMHLVLVDNEGRVRYSTAGRKRGDKVARSALGRGQPILCDGSTIGYLLVGDGPRETEFAVHLYRSIIGAGLLAGSFAALLGLALTRTLTKPLRVVRDAAERIGSGDLSCRAPVTSRDEIGALAIQFNAMADALERDERLRRRLMADVAHELRTPLAVMRGQVEAIQDGVFELSHENISPIRDQVLLMGRLIDDLRELALADAGQLRLEREQVEPQALVDRVVVAFQPRATAKGIVLTAELPGSLPVLLADSQRLDQVLGNLVTNAIQHTPSGGGITVGARVEDEQIVIAVSDTGSGIARGDLEHVFDRFYRADEARSRARGGTGLGLAIAKQIVEAHGGAIEVTSTQAAGSTFVIRLPLPKSKPS